MVACNASDAAQAFEYNEDTQLKQPSSGHCVDVHSGGPIVWMYGCSSGPNDSGSMARTVSVGRALQTCARAGGC